MILRRLTFAACCMCLGVLPAMAEEKLAYVIGNTRFGGPALDAPARDAVSISRTLLGLGFDVIRRQNTTARDLPIGSRAADTVAIYYSGRTDVNADGDIVLRGAQLGAGQSPGWPVLATANSLRAAGAKTVLVFIETCHIDGDGLAALPDDADASGLFLAISHDPEVGCSALEPDEVLAEQTGTAAEGTDEASATVAEPGAEDATAAENDTGSEDDPAGEPIPRFTERVRLAFATPNMAFADAFEAAAGQGWARSNLTAPLYIWPQQATAGSAPAGQLPPGALEMLATLPMAEQVRMRKVWQDAGLMDADGNVVDQTAAAPAPTTTILIAPSASSSGVTIVAPVAKPVNPIIPQNAPGGTRVAGQIAPVQPVAQAPQSSGTGLGASGAAPGGGVANAVQIFTPAPRRAALAALPTGDGLPEPYLIFGEIRPTNASFDPTETGEVQGSAVDTSDFSTRNQIRNDTPDLYAQLVAGGAFDPTDGSARGLARAIQTELARMNCYTSGIDGVWGNGSRRSVTAYFQQISETPTGLEPTLDLYRKIILNDDVSCPVVRQAAQPQRTTTTAAPRRAAPAPAPAPAPAAPSGGLNTNNLGTGIFR